MRVQLDPIIAVKDVEASSKWYQALFSLTSIHGGKAFDVLVNDIGEVVLCLHLWNEHDHPSMKDAAIPAGNGLIFYFKTDDLPHVRQNAEKLHAPITEDMHLNPNSLKQEFAMTDPDGYYLIVTELHQYEG